VGCHLGWYLAMGGNRGKNCEKWTLGSPKKHIKIKKTFHILNISFVFLLVGFTLLVFPLVSIYIFNC
jgi:hypothetical protein